MENYLKFDYIHIIDCDNNSALCDDEFILSIKDPSIIKSFQLVNIGSSPLSISYKNLIILLTYKKLLYG